MITKATTQDVDQLFDLIQMGVAEGGLLSRSKQEIKRLIDNFFVYKIKNRIIGCAGIDIYTQKIAELRSLYVIKENRRKKIASKLIKHCLKVAKSKGIREVITLSDKEDVFRKCGFSDQIGKQKALFLRIGD
jgi:N-acetylglutamate synthase-like GNAT family acetyltransferase